MSLCWQTPTFAYEPSEVEIRTLPPGSRFRFHNRPYYTRTGTVVRVSACCVQVEIDGSPKVREFTTAKGKHVKFTDSGREATYYAPETPVEPLCGKS